MNWNNQNWEYYKLEKLRGKKFCEEWPSIPEYLQYSIECFPDNIAFTTFANANGQRESISYTELALHIEALAKSLLKSLSRLEPGTRVAISGNNSPAWGITFLAIQCLGLVAVPLDRRKDAQFHQHIIKFSGAQVLCMDSALIEKLETADLMDEEWHVFSLDQSEKYQSIWSLIEQNRGEDSVNLAPNLTTLAPVTMDSTAALLTTSGTTGNEKLATLSHANFTSNVLQCVYPGLQEILSEDRMYLLLPLHHCYPLTAVFLEAIFHGSEVVFPRGLAIQQILQDMKEAQITVFMGIPVLFNKILHGVLQKVAEQSLLKRTIFQVMLSISSLANVMGKPIGKKLFAGILKALGFEHIRILICGAGTLMPSIGQKYRQFGLNFLQGYGLTEAAPVVTLNPADTPYVSSVGKLVPLIDSYLIGEQGEIGELCIKGPNVMQGYYNNPEATQEIFTEDGYLRTGDMGYFDAEGYFYITGRCKNVIVTDGGKNIYPEELEEQFQLCKTIEQVMVRGYGDREEVEIVVYPKLISEDWKEKISQRPEDYLTNDKKSLQEVLGAEQIKALLAEVKQINRGLEPFQKLKRVRIVLLPLEVTTTQKTRRFLVEERLERHNEGVLVSAGEL